MPDDTAQEKTVPRRHSFDRDLIIALAAIVVSLCALGVSVVQTLVMRAQQHASVWPRLTTSVDLDSNSVAVSVRNAGVGPAQVVSAEVLFDSLPAAGWAGLLTHTDSAAASTAGNTGRASVASLSDDVLVPGERKSLLQVDGVHARGFVVSGKRIGIRACYCSVFDRCWQLENARLMDDRSSDRITAVAHCDKPRTPTI